MQIKRNKTFVVIILVIMFLSTFSLGLITGIMVSRPNSTFSLDKQKKQINEDQLNTLNQAWEIIHTQYLNQPVDQENLIRGALKGMAESLNDPYSSYMSPEEFRSQNAPLKGEYTGIGAWVDTSGDYLVILSPMPNSPAELAGLKPGDKVVAIDSEDMTVFTPSQVLERILGPAGTKINLSILREGEVEVLEFDLERVVIPIPSVESKMLENSIGYIRLFTFGDNSTRDFTDALKALIDQKARGMIIDLRNNTGGYVETAIEITSLFIPEELIMVEEWGDGTREEYRAVGEAVDTNLPLVILVNEGTASASEITAGALQDLGRATLIGSETFGKGYIQNWVPLRNDNGAIRITIARWLTPKGRQIEEFGLTPDIPVDFTEDDLQNNTDPQLNRAIQFLKDEFANQSQ